MNIKYSGGLLAILSIVGCRAATEKPIATTTEQTIAVEAAAAPPLYCNATVVVGAERMDRYLPLLKGKRVGVVTNHTATVENRHLVDTLMQLQVNLVRVFSPEHGFRGTANAGEQVADGVDLQTGLPIVSLYGKTKKPRPEQLKGVDILLFDLQDVGARFYTYISTLYDIVSAAAENGLPVVVLDRPNPNGHYVDGPVLKKAFSSFVGRNEVPVVHGMTVGEYAQMINGEGWLDKALKCDLTVIPCTGWDHTKFYRVPVPPSPNLPNMRAIYLYPSLCFFEGTQVSVGRGTALPFQCFGHPQLQPDTTVGQPHAFTPAPNEGSKHPKLNGKRCRGYTFAREALTELRAAKQLNLSYLIACYRQLQLKDFFLSNRFIDLLAGSDQLRQQIMDGKTERAIRASWEPELEAFKAVRKKYLLYAE